MTIQKKWHGHGRLISSLALALSCATASFAAISVTDVNVAPGSGGTLSLSYRLNETATSVSIDVPGNATVAGGTAKGLNTVALPGSANGKAATITATAPAPDGPGGAAVLIPVTSPDNRATPASTNLVAVDVNRRLGSNTLGHIYLPTGFSQAGQKYLWVYAPDGTLVQSKNLSDIATSGSYPYGFAIARGDNLDRMVVHNRSAGADYVLGPDLGLIATLTGISTLVPGLAITPNTDSSTNATLPWNLWHSGNKTKDVRHYTVDISKSGAVAAPTQVAGETGSTGENSHDIAVDNANKFLFKVQVTDGGVGPLSTGGVNKWTSADNGATWTEDTTWLTNFLADVSTDLTNASSTLTTAGLVGGGITLAKGFDSNSPATSSVWVAVYGASWNRIYRANAGSGHIEQTIDVQAITVPEGAIAFAGKAVHFIEADAFGNLVISLNISLAANGAGQYARYFAVLAPNSGTNTTTLANIPVSLPLEVVSATTSSPRASNTGTVSVTLTVTPRDYSGIVADNVQVSIDLSSLTGDPLTANTVMTRGTPGPNGTTAPFTTTVTIPANIDLNNSGSFELPYKVTATGYPDGFTGRLVQNVYNAYVPSWTATTAAPVNSSAVTNGSTAYIGDDAGNVYAYNASTGQPVASFGSGGVVSLSGAVKGHLAYMRGRLYVATADHVYILNGGTGVELGSKAIANVSSLDVNPIVPDAVFVAAGNTILKLDSKTAQQLSVTPDVGLAVNRVAVLPSLNSNTLSAATVVAGTEGEASGDNIGKNGKIIAFAAEDLSPAYLDSVTSEPTFVVATDPLGAVRSKAAASTANIDGIDSNFFTIGGASGEYYINTDTGVKVATWVAGSNGGANVGGNPYTPGAPVDANPTIPIAVGGTDANGKENLRVAFATAGTASQGGSIFLLVSSNGERASYGGYPAPLTAPGSGFAAGAGILAVNPSAAGLRTLYIGSDAVDQRFFGLDTKPDDISYAATAAKKHIFDPTDTVSFPGAVAGAFNSTPALAADKVVVGSAAKRVYGFPSLTAVRPGVVSVSPANGANGVSTSAELSVVFNQDVTGAIFDSTTVMLLDETGTDIGVFATVDADTKTVALQVLGALVANKTYTLVITGAAGTQPFSSTFYTGVPPFVKGDINGDGVFNIADVKSALRMAGGLEPATTQALNASDNKFTSGSITVEDAVFLARVLAGKASF
jgi:hypothetical protein